MTVLVWGEGGRERRGRVGERDRHRETLSKLSKLSSCRKLVLRLIALLVMVHEA